MREQSKCIEQAYQAEIMITMKMGYEDVRDPAPPDLVFDHLDLGAFTAINQVIIPVMRNHLAGWMTVKSRYGGVVSQYGYRKHVGKNTEKFGGGEEMNDE
jgi:hypothetical protein